MKIFFCSKLGCLFTYVMSVHIQVFQDILKTNALNNISYCVINFKFSSHFKIDAHILIKDNFHSTKLMIEISIYWNNHRISMNDDVVFTSHTPHFHRARTVPNC